MAGCQPKKTRKAKVDRISSLPDEVISHILSFLPTKEAFGTSILSNRWKYLWTSITNLHFEAPERNYNIFKKTGDVDEKMEGFRNFVNHVFHNCTSPCIQNLILDMKFEKCSDFTNWLDEAIKRNVRELDINGGMCDWSLSGYSCITLKKLTLFNYQPQPHNEDNIVSVNLPCLKVLYITGDSFLSGHVETLITSCPVLKDLTLSGFFIYNYNEGCFMVASPTLQRLHFQLLEYSCKGDRELSVMAPSLEYLHLTGYPYNFNVTGDFSSLVKACVKFEKIHERVFNGGIQGFSTLPKFQNVTCLEVIITQDTRLWSILPRLIGSSPSLEVLSLGQGIDISDNTWVEPKFVPKCFGIHLAVIKIKGFKGRTHELQLIKYFLANGKVLQSILINCGGLTQVEEMEFCGQLLKLSRVSGLCQIQFHGDFISNL